MPGAKKLQPITVPCPKQAVDLMGNSQFLFPPSQDSGACCSDLGSQERNGFSLASQVTEQEAACTGIDILWLAWC